MLNQRELERGGYFCEKCTAKSSNALYDSYSYLACKAEDALDMQLSGRIIRISRTETSKVDFLVHMRMVP